MEEKAARKKHQSDAETDFIVLINLDDSYSAVLQNLLFQHPRKITISFNSHGEARCPGLSRISTYFVSLVSQRFDEKELPSKDSLELWTSPLSLTPSLAGGVANDRQAIIEDGMTR